MVREVLSLSFCSRISIGYAYTNGRSRKSRRKFEVQYCINVPKGHTYT